MEYKKIPVKKLKIGDLLESYLPTLPGSFFKLNDEDALQSFREECLSTISAAMTNQLEKDCRFDFSTFNLKSQFRQPFVWLGDCSDALDDPTLHIAAEKLYTSSYFFIEGTFYDDLRYSQNKSLRPFSQKTMETTHLRDLRIYIGKPYFYVHQGNCEHPFVFLDPVLICHFCTTCHGVAPSSYIEQRGTR
ncbi:unnamed protein product [Echinostoma caproni]|uniref:snRNA-activating protein complex subunit 3 n=1 Tax=Echinostoma caproni TaxID=27848 RepID=A0A183BD78_9TREM|nr:unnamed protein product [Echinostoma caproni]